MSQRPWESDPNRSQWWNNPQQQQAPPPPPPGGYGAPGGFYSSWAPPVPAAFPFANGQFQAPSLGPWGTWAQPPPQSMPQDGMSIDGYGNHGYHPPPLPSSMANGGGPALGGGANTLPPERKVKRKWTKAEKRLRKQLLEQQKPKYQGQQTTKQQHQQQQYQVQSQAQPPPQAPKAFPQVPASLPALPPGGGKMPRNRGKKKAKNQLPPPQNPNPPPAPPKQQKTPSLFVHQTDRSVTSAPSAASGGVPDPTPSYLAQASLPPKRAAQPQPLLVIIDLNGTLLHRPSHRAPTTFVERARARGFLTDCLDAFYVVIWSSARPDNVSRMVNQLLPAPAQRGRVLATWGRDRFGLSSADYYQRTQCYKRLTKLWEDPGVAASHPLAGGRWGQANTVLIDDSVEKARSEPYNAVTIPEFVGKKEGGDVLPLVHEYLCLLSMQTDVSAFIRTHPFKADEATIAEYARWATEGYEPEGEAKN